MNNFSDIYVKSSHPFGEPIKGSPFGLARFSSVELTKTKEKQITSFQDRCTTAMIVPMLKWYFKREGFALSQYKDLLSQIEDLIKYLRIVSRITTHQMHPMYLGYIGKFIFDEEKDCTYEVVLYTNAAMGYSVNGKMMLIVQLSDGKLTVKKNINYSDFRSNYFGPQEDNILKNIDKVNYLLSNIDNMHPFIRDQVLEKCKELMNLVRISQVVIHNNFDIFKVFLEPIEEFMTLYTDSKLKKKITFEPDIRTIPLKAILKDRAFLTVPEMECDGYLVDTDLSVVDKRVSKSIDRLDNIVVIIDEPNMNIYYDDGVFSMDDADVLPGSVIHNLLKIDRERYIKDLNMVTEDGKATPMTSINHPIVGMLCALAYRDKVDNLLRDVHAAWSVPSSMMEAFKAQGGNLEEGRFEISSLPPMNLSSMMPENHQSLMSKEDFDRMNKAEANDILKNLLGDTGGDHNENN